MAHRPKPSGREARPAKQAAHDGPLWFDRARGLCELLGWPSSDAGDGLGLLGRDTAALNKPVARLDEADFELLFGQKTDPHVLVPIALERVRHRLLSGGVDEGLLRCLLYLGDEFWRDLGPPARRARAGRQPFAFSFRHAILGESCGFTRSSSNEASGRPRSDGLRHGALCARHGLVGRRSRLKTPRSGARSPCALPSPARAACP